MEAGSVVALIVLRHRQVATGAKDAYGKPVMAEETKSFSATAYAPTTGVDTPVVDGVQANLGGTIYFRDQVIDGLPSDEWTVRGVRYGAEGRASEWRGLDDVIRGSVVTLKVQELARD